MKQHIPSSTRTVGASAAGASSAPIIVWVDDQALAAEAMNAAAATGRQAVRIDDPERARALWRRAHAVIVDATAGHIVRGQGWERHPRVILLGAEHGEPEWKLAALLHTEAVFRVPAETPDLLRLLGHSSGEALGNQRSEGSRITVVTGAGGGVGASTFACALGFRCSGFVVDAAYPLGRLDLICGLEEHPGMRWDDLSGNTQGLDAAELAAATITHDGCSFLTGEHPPAAKVFRDVIDSVENYPGHCIIDMPWHAPWRDKVLAAADDVVVVAPAELRSSLLLKQQVEVLNALSVEHAVVATHRGWSGLSGADIEKIAGAEVIAEYPHSQSLAKRIELGGARSWPRPMLRAVEAVL